ncbi:alpha/beta hydrolase [Streptomyces sp. NPDC005181]|uniref:alpha/beta fold hydrolase n=1 Tax=Streptomyces sp. NPDC005181 TaxID=3156869 RepID=UPI00339EC487
MDERRTAQHATPLAPPILWKECHTMTISTPGSVSRTFELRDGLSITVDERGDAAAAGGSGILLLHGGGGTQSVAGLAAALSEHSYVITPTHPGFDGQPRPDWFDSVTDLALAYLDLLDVLNLREVLVIGNSLGGWIASDMALHDVSGRLSGLVVMNAVGISTDGPAKITDVRALPPTEVGRLAFHNPSLLPDPATLSDAQETAAAGNQSALELYAGEPYMHDPKLRRRLHRVTLPVLVLWGEQDGVVPAEYGRVYADSFANAYFQPVINAGHMPHVEQPDLTLDAIEAFVAGKLAEVTMG